MMGQSQKPHDLQFINLSKRARLSEDDQATVRAHVMRDFGSKSKSARGKPSVKEIEEADLHNARPHMKILRFRLGPVGWTKKRRQVIYRTHLRHVHPISRMRSRSGIGAVENESGEEGYPSVGIVTTSKTISAGSGLLSGRKSPQDRQVATLKGNTTYRSNNRDSRGPKPRHFYPSNIGVDLADPFDTVPAPNTRRTHRLISHCKSTFVSNPT